MADIDERSRINLFAVAVAIPILTSLALYVAAISWTAVNAAKVNEEQSQAIKESRELIFTNKDDVMIYLIEIDKRTIRIEEYLKHKEK